MSVTGSNHGSSHGSRRDIDSLALGSILGKTSQGNQFSQIYFSSPGILERRQEVSEAEQPQHWEDRSAQASAEDSNTEPGL